MGHESTSTTQKYIDFMNTQSRMIEHSARKNRQATNALKGNT
jgi:hypothetical protein